MGPWETATFNGLQTIERGSFPLNVTLEAEDCTQHKSKVVRRPNTRLRGMAGQETMEGGSFPWDHGKLVNYWSG